MNILRFHITENGETTAFYYLDGELIRSWCRESIKEVADEVNKFLNNNQVQIEGVYVFRAHKGDDI